MPGWLQKSYTLPWEGRHPPMVFMSWIDHSHGSDQIMTRYARKCAIFFSYPWERRGKLAKIYTGTVCRICSKPLAPKMGLDCTRSSKLESNGRTDGRTLPSALSPGYTMLHNQGFNQNIHLPYLYALSETESWTFQDSIFIQTLPQCSYQKSSVHMPLLSIVAV